MQQNTAPLTKLEHFTALAMSGLLAGTECQHMDDGELATYAVNAATATLAELDDRVFQVRELLDYDGDADCRLSETDESQ
tara:strand:+ start:217 stop:456 length:240 start_codon:yes stop_codon:yes gene_type:complete